MATATALTIAVTAAIAASRPTFAPRQAPPPPLPCPPHPRRLPLALPLPLARHPLPRCGPFPTSVLAALPLRRKVSIIPPPVTCPHPATASRHPRSMAPAAGSRYTGTAIAACCVARIVRPRSTLPLRLTSGFLVQPVATPSSPSSLLVAHSAVSSAATPLQMLVTTTNPAFAMSAVPPVRRPRLPCPRVYHRAVASGPAASVRAPQPRPCRLHQSRLHQMLPILHTPLQLSTTQLRRC